MRELAFDPKISFVSRDWSAKQAQSGSISHNGFPSARQSVYAAEFGQSIRLSGENVAYNFCGSMDVTRAANAFIDQWWNSAGHRANMLGSFGTIGVGVVITARGQCFGTQIFK
jgi:uncharacterized protein YkwD